MKRFNSPIVFTSNYEAIDEQSGVLKGVVIAEEGEAKGHGVFLNKKFIQDVVVKGKEFGDVGVKCRFGHPNMCSDALGTYLGRFKNFRTRRNNDIEDTGYQAIADLYLDETAKKSPKGNLYEYVLSLAKSAPDHFGNSIVFRSGEEIYKKEKDSEGNEIEKAYATIEELHESDLVDSPAATNSLFSQFDGSELAYQVTTFLDGNPQIFPLLAQQPEIVEQFLNKYSQYTQIKMEKTELKDRVSLLEKGIEALKNMFSKKEEFKIIVCPVCAYNIDTAVITPNEDGNYICPECGAEISPEGVEMKKAEEPEKVDFEQKYNEINSVVESLTVAKTESENKVAELTAELSEVKTKLAEFEAKREEMLQLESRLKEFATIADIPEVQNIVANLEKKKGKKEETKEEIVARHKNKK